MGGSPTPEYGAEGLGPLAPGAPEIVSGEGGCFGLLLDGCILQYSLKVGS
jgi:hypothetical protein